MGITLTTSDGIRDTNTVVLEPAVFDALLRWALKPEAIAALEGVSDE
jgi:hypothetical protein